MVAHWPPRAEHQGEIGRMPPRQRQYSAASQSALDLGAPLGVRVLLARRDQVVDGASVDESGVDLVETRNAAHAHRRLELVV